MASLKNFLMCVCVITVVSGLSVSVVSGWAFYTKFQSLDELYPGCEDVCKEGNATCHKFWDELKVKWKETQNRNLAIAGIACATGLTQLFIAAMLVYGSDKTGGRTLAKRYMLSNIVVFLVLVICVVTAVVDDHLDPFAFPIELKKALDLESRNHFFVILEYGINGFIMWITADATYVFLTIVFASCFLRYCHTEKVFNLPGGDESDEDKVDNK